MKQINQFIRKHFDYTIRMNRDKAKSICNDIIEIWDNFSDAYQWQGKAIEPPHEILLFYAYLKTYYDWVKKYASFFVLQTEDDIQIINEHINNSNIYDPDELHKLKEYVIDEVNILKINAPFKEFYHLCGKMFEEAEEDDCVVGGMNIFIYIYYCYLYAFPNITAYLIDSIEYYFKMHDDKDCEKEADKDVKRKRNNTAIIIETTKNDIVDKTARIKGFDDKIQLKEFDHKELWSLLINEKCIDNMSFEKFDSVLNQKSENDIINWDNAGRAAICAQYIFTKYPMQCAELIFRVKNKIIKSKTYSDYKNKHSKRARLDEFESKLKKDILVGCR